MNTARTILLGGVLGVALAGCIGWASAGNDELPETEIDPVEVTQVEELPACPTEDSENCYWDAETMGNKLGEDIVTIVEDTVDEVVDEMAPVQPIEVPYEGQWDEDPGEGYLLCGDDAAPALDYNEVWGWWAYCEPAMVNEDGTLWQG